MEIRVQRRDFLAELGPAQRIAETRTTVPILSHLLLSVRGDRLHLAATDLDVSLTSSCAGEAKAEGSIAVQAKKFAEIVRASAAEDIHLVQESERALTIAAGKARFRIHGLPSADFPTLPQVEPKAEIELPFAVFHRMIGKILFAVSTEDSRFQISGALLHLKPGGVEMVATDGHRLALVEVALPGNQSEDSVLVPRKALRELLRFESDGNLRFRRGEHHLSFGTEQRELTCRILDGAFPDYERVIARTNDKQLVFDRKALAEAVQRVALMTGERARGVRFEFAPHEVTIAAANPDLGEASETLPTDYAGSEFRLGINPDYMVQFLAAVETEKVLIELKDENSQCVGHPHGGDERYLCVIMPMRI